MGKKTKLREAQRQRAADTIAAVLSAHSRRRAQPALVATYRDFGAQFHDKFEPYRAFAVRAPDKWRCRSKSRREGDRFIDLVSHAFAFYPLPVHFQSVWGDDVDNEFLGPAQDVGANPAARPARPDLRLWYIIAGTGGSLYESATHPYLTRLETHYFLKAPPSLTSTRRAFWYAFARATTDDTQIALKVAQTRLADFSVATAFWQDIARFFAGQPSTVAEMDELIDFIRHARAADPNFSLKGRSLDTLRRRADEWRRAELAQSCGCDGDWAGRAQPNAEYRVGSGGNETIWYFRQIKTGMGLFTEAERMRHCVATYVYCCKQGDRSIWSLTRQAACGKRRRCVTIEVSDSGTIGQCRGFANRMPFAEEIEIIDRWAQDYSLFYLHF